jgi:hypothetical protein
MARSGGEIVTVCVQMVGSYGHEHPKNGRQSAANIDTGRLPAVFKVFMPLPLTIIRKK